MNLTKEQLLSMLKNAYIRGVYEHMEQRYRNTESNVRDYPTIHIPDHIVHDLIPEEL